MPGDFLEDDLAGFFDPDEFGTTAYLEGSVPINGIFERRYVDIGGMESFAPTLLCASSVVAANGIVGGTVLSVDGLDYAVAVPEADGAGLTLLVLKLRGRTVTYPVVFSSDFSAEFA